MGLTACTFEVAGASGCSASTTNSGLRAGPEWHQDGGKRERGG